MKVRQNTAEAWQDSAKALQNIKIDGRAYQHSSRQRLHSPRGRRVFAKTPDSGYACFEIAHGEQRRYCGMGGKPLRFSAGDMLCLKNTASLSR
jgi:hypothetical protein